MNRILRKYHHWLAIAFATPLITTTITGIAFPIAKLLHQRQLAGFLLHIHTMEIFGLEEVFPMITGMGLLGLLVTGMYMTRLFRQRRALS